MNFEYYGKYLGLRFAYVIFVTADHEIFVNSVVDKEWIRNEIEYQFYVVTDGYVK